MEDLRGLEPAFVIFAVDRLIDQSDGRFIKTEKGLLLYEQGFGEWSDYCPTAIGIKSAGFLQSIPLLADLTGRRRLGKKKKKRKKKAENSTVPNVTMCARVYAFFFFTHLGYHFEEE